MSRRPWLYCPDPKCDGEMELRVPRKPPKGMPPRFWGCTRYRGHECRQVVPAGRDGRPIYGPDLVCTACAWERHQRELRPNSEHTCPDRNPQERFKQANRGRRGRK